MAYLVIAEDAVVVGEEVRDEVVPRRVGCHERVGEKNYRDQGAILRARKTVGYFTTAGEGN